MESNSKMASRDIFIVYTDRSCVVIFSPFDWPVKAF